jgi:hypothetical protein
VFEQLHEPYRVASGEDTMQEPLHPEAVGYGFATAALRRPTSGGW